VELEDSVEFVHFTLFFLLGIEWTSSHDAVNPCHEWKCYELGRLGRLGARFGMAGIETERGRKT
jgi:hypothetical protein